ncbi:MAG: hypothetical protein AAF700_03795 [Pseudomonadota bacterium]
MNILASLPEIKVAEMTRRWWHPVLDALSADLLRPFGRAFDRASRTTPLTVDELNSSLQMKLHYANESQNRSSSAVGRILNRFSQTDPNYVVFPGRHAEQILEIAGTETSQKPDSAKTYLVRKDIAQIALDALRLGNIRSC